MDENRVSPCYKYNSYNLPTSVKKEALFDDVPMFFNKYNLTYLNLFSFVGCLKAQGMSGLQISFHSNSIQSYLGKRSAYWKGIEIRRQGKIIINIKKVLLNVIVLLRFRERRQS